MNQPVDHAQTTSGGSFVPSNRTVTVGVVGPGKLGSVLTSALYKLQRLAWVLCHSEAQAMSIGDQYNWTISPYFDVADIYDVPDIIVLTVPDSSIHAVASDLAIHFNERLAGKLVLHCSGASGLEVLSPITRCGGRIAAAHPFQTFGVPTDIALRGIAWGIECSQEDFSDISGLVASLGGNPVVLPEATRQMKELYHASAVAASNFITMLLSLSKQLIENAGLEPLDFLPPIVYTATENVIQSISEQGQTPLTGPVSRGEIETIDKHLRALQWAPHIGIPYVYLSLATLELAWQSGYINSEQYEKLRDLLEGFLVEIRS